MSVILLSSVRLLGSAATSRARRAGPPRTDADLVERARGGDDGAAEEIYRRHVDRVAGIAARILRSRADAEDVVQETFIAVLGHLDTVRDGDALGGYLAQTAVRTCRKRLRRRRILAFFSLEAAVEDAGFEATATEAASADVRAELALLDRALGSLSADARIAWTLRRVEGVALDEVAAACGHSLATAKRRIADGDAHVRAHVAFDVDDEEADA